MTDDLTQATIEAEAKASLWLRHFESDPPDQSIQLIGSADESYRPSVDEALQTESEDDEGSSVDEGLKSESEDDEGSKMSDSTDTKVTAGNKTATRYRQQLRMNRINDATGMLRKGFYGFFSIFTDQVSISDL